MAAAYLFYYCVMMRAISTDQFSEEQHDNGQMCVFENDDPNDTEAAIVDGKLAKQIGIRTADNATLTVINAGTPIPTRSYVVLTTAHVNQTELHVDVLYGNRFTADSNKRIGSLSLLDIAEAPRLDHTFFNSNIFLR